MSAHDAAADEVAAAKREVRERIWKLLDTQGAAQPSGAAGHIPSFVGADAAADRLTQLPAWAAARVIKANPDRAQLPARVRALSSGKTVYMAVPRLETVEPFYLLAPATDQPRRGPARGSDAGLIRPETVIVTTVHDLQVVDEPIPASLHDFRVDYIVTPTLVVQCPPSPPPGGIDWERVTPQQLAAIPVLAERRANAGS